MDTLEHLIQCAGCRAWFAPPTLDVCRSCDKPYCPACVLVEPQKACLTKQNELIRIFTEHAASEGICEQSALSYELFSRALMGVSKSLAVNVELVSRQRGRIASLDKHAHAERCAAASAHLYVIWYDILADLYTRTRRHFEAFTKAAKQGEHVILLDVTIHASLTAMESIAAQLAALALQLLAEKGSPYL